MDRSPFDRRAAEYEAWFDAHEAVYRSELAALGRVETAQTLFDADGGDDRCTTEASHGEGSFVAIAARR